MMSSGLDSERASTLGGHASLSAQHTPETSAWTWRLTLAGLSLITWTVPSLSGLNILFHSRRAQV